MTVKQNAEAIAALNSGMAELISLMKGQPDRGRELAPVTLDPTDVRSQREISRMKSVGAAQKISRETFDSARADYDAALEAQAKAKKAKDKAMVDATTDVLKHAKRAFAQAQLGWNADLDLPSEIVVRYADGSEIVVPCYKPTISRSGNLLGGASSKVTKNGVDYQLSANVTIRKGQ